MARRSPCQQQGTVLGFQGWPQSCAFPQLLPTRLLPRQPPAPRPTGFIAADDELRVLSLMYLLQANMGWSSRVGQQGWSSQAGPAWEGTSGRRRALPQMQHRAEHSKAEKSRGRRKEQTARSRHLASELVGSGSGSAGPSGAAAAQRQAPRWHPRQLQKKNSRPQIKTQITHDKLKSVTCTRGQGGPVRAAGVRMLSGWGPGKARTAEAPLPP